MGNTLPSFKDLVVPTSLADVAESDFLVLQAVGDSGYAEYLVEVVVLVAEVVVLVVERNAFLFTSGTY